MRTYTSLTNFINQTKVRAELKVENLNENSVIEKNILFHTIGKKKVKYCQQLQVQKLNILNIITRDIST